MTGNIGGETNSQSMDADSQNDRCTLRDVVSYVESAKRFIIIQITIYFCLLGINNVIY